MKVSFVNKTIKFETIKKVSFVNYICKINKKIIKIELNINNCTINLYCNRRGLISLVEFCNNETQTSLLIKQLNMTALSYQIFRVSPRPMVSCKLKTSLNKT